MDFGEGLGVVRHTGVMLRMVKTVVPSKQLSSSGGAVRSSEGEAVLPSSGSILSVDKLAEFNLLADRLTVPDRAESQAPGLLPTGAISLQVGRQEVLVPAQLNLKIEFSPQKNYL